MISSVTPSLVAAAELPPAAEGAAGAAGRAPARPRAAGVILLPGGVASAKVAQAAAKAAKLAAPPRAGPSASGYAGAVAAALSSASAAKGTSKSSGSKATSSAAKKKAGPLDFLADPKLSVEDKLLRLLSYLNDKWNKDLDKKMKELKTDGGTTASGSSGSKSSSASKSGGVTGFLGGLVGMAKDVMPGIGVGLDLLSTPAVRSTLSSVAGPGLAALATAMGMPELAPLALQYGPEIVDAAASVAKDASPASSSRAKTSSSGGSSSSSSSSASANAIGSDRDAQLKLMEIQRIMDQQKEMFSLTSNLLRTGHDARMAVIQNLR